MTNIHSQWFPCAADLQGPHEVHEGLEHGRQVPAARKPGYVRTDFLDAASLTRAEWIIPDYAQTSGAMRALAAELNHQQPGNPAKLATAMVELVKMEQPPLRLALGSDTVKVLEDKNAFVARELEAHRALSLSTDFT